MLNRIEHQYFKDITRYHTLSEEEERTLVRRVQEGDRQALHDLVTHNLRFVVSVARHYQGKGFSLLELINEGNLGLYKAAKRFNEQKDVKFISYAVWWVRQAIQKAIFEHACIVKIPPSKLTMINRFKKLLEESGNDFQTTVSRPEFKPFEKEISELLEKINPLSLDTPLQGSESGESSTSLLDILGNEPDQEERLEKLEIRNVVDTVLANLGQREEMILRMYYGINFEREYTLEEIGNKLKLTRERVRQIKNKALRKLFRSQLLIDKILPGEDEKK